MSVTDDLRNELHAVKVDVAVLQSELRAHRQTSEDRHREVMDAIKDRTVEGSVRITPSNAVAWAKAIGTLAAIASAVAAGVYGGQAAQVVAAPEPVEQGAP